MRASELQGKYLKMFFDGHTMDPTGIARKSEAELVEELARILGPDRLAQALGGVDKSQTESQRAVAGQEGN